MEPVKRPITAYYVAKTCDLAALEKRAGHPVAARRRRFLAFEPKPGALVVVFSFGVVVCYRTETRTANRLVRIAGELGVDPVAKPPTERYEVLVDETAKPTVEFNHIVLNRETSDTLYLISEVIAQSAAIDFIESRVEEAIRRFDPIIERLEDDGSVRATDRRLRRAIGSGRSIIQYVITQIALLDHPDITWEDKEFEALYGNLRQMFELDDRFKALQERLDFLHETSELLLTIRQNQKAFWLEAAIVALFVIDIVLVFYEFLVQ